MDSRSDTILMRQEIDGLQVRLLQLVSCSHFTGQEAVGFRLDPYNGSHFLRQEIHGVQLRNLQSASCLPSEMEVTVETG